MKIYSDDYLESESGYIGKKLNQEFINATGKDKERYRAIILYLRERHFREKGVCKINSEPMIRLR